MGFRTCDRSQIDFLGYSLDDFVEPDAKCRFVVQLVSMLQLDKLYKSYSDVGADANDPSSMLCAWFLAYSEGISSSRELEKHCKRDTHFMYASSHLRPDHTTLNRFRKKHLTLISEYFVQIIRMAQEKGISDFKHITLDGTKIQASASPRKSKDEEGLDRYLVAVRRNITEYMKRCDQTDQFEDESTSGDIRSIRRELQRLKNLEKTLIERKDELEQRKQHIKKEHQETHQINITEPEAYNMRHANGKQTLPAYNAQASVDSKTELIVAADVVQDRADFAQFSLQHQAIEDNLGKDPERKHTADAGYHSLDQLEYIEAHQIDAVVCDPNPQHRSLTKTLPTVKELLKSGRRLERSDFIYHSKEDTYECPRGQILSFSHAQQKDDKKIRYYKTSNCDGCLLSKQCLSKKNKTKTRMIQRDERELLAEQMAIKLSTDEAKQRLIVRKTTVEPVFGNLKENLGFRRFSLRGLENVKNEFKLMAIAHNINKLFKMKDTIITSVRDFLSSLFVQRRFNWCAT